MELGRKRFDEKKVQSEIVSGYAEQLYGWLECNTDPKKTGAIFNMQEQMIENRAWKKLRGIGQVDICRLCGEQKGTLQHLLSGCKKLTVTDYIKRRDNALKIMAVEWGEKEGLLPEKTRWYNER